MSNRPRRPPLAFLVCMLWQTGPAFASCDAILQLAQIHDEFFAITRETGDFQVRAAARLYPKLADLDVEAFVDTLDPGPSRDDIIEGLEEARNLARDVITTGDLSPFRILDARDEVQTLANFVDASGCMDQARGGTGGSGQSGGGQGVGSESGKGTLKFGPKSASGSASAYEEDAKVSLLVFLIVGGALVLAGGTILVLRSRPVKIHRVVRQPRHLINLSFQANCTDPEGATSSHPVTAQDISLGGMKLRVPQPLPKDTRLTFTLPIGEVQASIIWSNTHYAGILFDTWLSETDLNALLAES